MLLAFHLLVAIALAVDLGLLHRRPHAVGVREAAVLTAAWITLGLGFGAAVFVVVGAQAGTEYVTAYLIEKSLSIDNLFVFVLVFAHFGVAAEDQHRVLFWGVLGAIVMRGALITAGIAVVHAFEPVLYLFGAILVWSALKILRTDENGIEPQKNPILRWARRLLPVTDGPRASALWVGEPGPRGGLRTMVTPLFIALIFLEFTDLFFAVDSIPAVFAVTGDSMVAYTSNVCAILGLRSMYFLLALVVTKLRFLKHGLATVLLLIGAKMLLREIVHVSPFLSLTIVVGLLSVSTAASLWALRRPQPESTPKTTRRAESED